MEIRMRSVYLDHNATTPVRPEVVDAMAACLSGPPGNPSSLHRFGREAARLRDEARAALARAAGCEPEEVIFTSGGTEADNLVLRGAVSEERPHLVTVATEHEAVLHTVGSREGADRAATILPVDEDGRVDPEHVGRAIGSRTALVSVMAANNETGVLQRIESIGPVCRARGALFHTDAVQLFGKLPFRFRDLPLDAASLSSHKLGGPKGVGALIVRRGVRIRPLVTGGGQERRIRPGTENLPGIVGFARAAELADQEVGEEAPRLAALRDRLERGILRIAPGARVNGARSPRLPNTSNVSFPGLDGETLLVSLDLEGVAVSTGAACNAGAAEPSHVLLAMGRTREEAGASLRFSLGRTTRDSEIDEALDVLARVIARLTCTGSIPEPGRALSRE
jgi:cysteine desulfurase